MSRADFAMRIELPGGVTPVQSGQQLVSIDSSGLCSVPFERVVVPSGQDLVVALVSFNGRIHV